MTITRTLPIGGVTEENTAPHWRCLEYSFIQERDGTVHTRRIGNVARVGCISVKLLVVYVVGSEDQKTLCSAMNIALWSCGVEVFRQRTTGFPSRKSPPQLITKTSQLLTAFDAIYSYPPVTVSQKQSLLLV